MPGIAEETDVKLLNNGLKLVIGCTYASIDEINELIEELEEARETMGPSKVCATACNNKECVSNL
jgi:hypothetical protein